MVSDRVFDVPFATSIARVICAAALRVRILSLRRSVDRMIAMAPGANLRKYPAASSPVANGALPAGGTIALRAAGRTPTAPSPRLRSDGRQLRRARGTRVLPSGRACGGRRALLRQRTRRPLSSRQAGRCSFVLDAERPPPLLQGAPERPPRRTVPRHDVQRRGGYRHHTRRCARPGARDGGSNGSAPFGARFAAPASASARPPAMTTRCAPLWHRATRQDRSSGRTAGLCRSSDRQAEGTRHPGDGREWLRFEDAHHAQLRHHVPDRWTGRRRKRSQRSRRHGARVESASRTRAASRR